jgi:hypothetical protein
MSMNVHAARTPLRPLGMEVSGEMVSRSGWTASTDVRSNSSRLEGARRPERVATCRSRIGLPPTDDQMVNEADVDSRCSISQRTSDPYILGTRGRDRRLCRMRYKRGYAASRFMPNARGALL